MRLLKKKSKDKGMSYMALPGFINKYKMPSALLLQPNDVEKIVAKYYDRDIEKLRSKARHREDVECRQVIMFFLKTGSKMTLAQIGRRFNRDHTTVIYAIQTVYNALETNPHFKKQFTYLESILK